MKCPLMLTDWHPKPTEKKWELLDCLKAECAWWAPIAECCSVLNAACELWRIGDALEELVDKMPTKGGMTL